MKRICSRPGKPIFLLTAIWMLLIIPIYSASADTRLMVVSDLHYLAPALYQDSELFLQALRNGDGKITQFGDILLQALYRQILQEQPDALIVTGDLTFNGEKESHIALADWFRTVEAAGVPVWVIPGNHDINVISPFGFGKETYYRTEAVTPEEFREIYADFTSPGETGFSYIVPVSDHLWVAMTDVAWYQEHAETFGMFSSDHAVWLEKVLQSAGESSATVITATHHSLLAHTEFAKENFLMFGHESMSALAHQYGVHLNLSGHLHIQHIVRDNGLADAALGAFCIWPHRYALVTLDSGQKLRYEARALDESNLPGNFLQVSREWFAGITRDKVTAALTGTGKETRLMADYAARFNLAYFSGTYRKNDVSWTEDPAFALWQNQAGSAFWQYMKTVMNESAEDPLHWEEAR